MSKFSVLSLFAIFLVIFSACQKELSFAELDNTVPPVNSGTSVYTMIGAPGGCTSPVLNGIFKAGTATDTSNWIIVKVDVTTVGTYSISTSTTNGFKFSGAGSFTQTGLQTIKLLASGTPATDGSFDFTVGPTTCKFPVNCIPGPISATCKDCAYVPMCVGIKYSFSDTMGGIGSVRSDEYLSSSDTMIDGKIYKKITATTGVSYVNCTNGETTVIAYNPVSNNGNTVEKIKTTAIKANAPVGTQWTDTLTNSMGQAVLQRYTIQTKGLTRKVGTFTFNEIIVVNLETGIDVPGIGFFAAGFTKYLFAKDIGLVETISENPISGEVLYHSVIKSYFIP